MWLNPTATDDVDTPSGDASLTFTTSFANPISHIFFREAVLDADDVLRADEIRIGTTWGDVVLVPEPGSVTLLSLGAAALLIFRRAPPPCLIFRLGLGWEAGSVKPRLFCYMIVPVVGTGQYEAILARCILCKGVASRCVGELILHHVAK